MALQNTHGTIPAPSVKRHTGFKRDRPDPRDFNKVYGAAQVPSSDDHPVVDLRKYINNVFTQGGLGTCAACVVCAAYKLELHRQSEEAGRTYYHTDASRLFLYYNARLYDGTTDTDSGVSFRDTLKAANDLGICRESLWPYDVLKFADKPSTASYEDADGNIVCEYASLKQHIDQFRACLRSGFPFTFGFLCYDSFDDILNDGVMPIPTEEEIAKTLDPVGHGVLAVGYNDNTECITVLNSWGKGFGDKGYFYMPYTYITDRNRAFDFWKIERACEKFEIEIQTLP